MRLRSPKVVTEGRVEKAEGVDPGSPLLHSRYEWQARYRKYLVLDLATYAIILILLMSVVALILYLMIPDARLGILIIVLVTVAVLIPEIWSKAPLGLSHPPGLYKEGLMHPKGFFVPYGELRDVDVTKPMVPVLMHDMVNLHPYFEHPGEDYSDWDFEAHILGDDGVEMLRSRVAEINEELGV
jgi:hypothetical protein